MARLYSVTKRPPTRNFPRGAFKVSWRNAEGRQQSETFGTSAEANDKGQEVARLLRRGVSTDTERGRQPLGEYILAWARHENARKSNRPETSRKRETTIVNHILGTPLGRMELGKVRRTHIKAWIDDAMEDAAEDGLTTTQARHAFAQIWGALEEAVADNVVGKNEARGLEVRRVGKTRGHVVLTWDDIRLLADNIQDRYRALILTLGFTGIRVGEALGLTVPDILWDSHELNVYRQLHYGKYFGPLKNEAQRKSRHQWPYLPKFPGVVEDALRDHIANGWTGTLDKETMVFGAGISGPAPYADPARTRPWRKYGLDDQAVINAAASDNLAQAAEDLGQPFPRFYQWVRTLRRVSGNGMGLALPVTDTQQWVERDRPDAPPISRNALNSTFHSALDRAGLLPATKVHDLRHSWATNMIQQGMTVPDVAWQMGDSPETVYKTYGHVSRKMLAEGFDHLLPGMLPERPLKALGNGR